MSPEVGDSRDDSRLFLFYVASPSTFNLWRCGRLICFRLLFAVANNCLCQIGDFENEFSVVICQTQQSTIATASLGLLKPAEVVSRSCCWESFPFSAFRFPFILAMSSEVRGRWFFYLFLLTLWYARWLFYEKVQSYSPFCLFYSGCGHSDISIGADGGRGV